MFSGDNWTQELRIVETQCIHAAENLRCRDQHQKGSGAFIRTNREIQVILNSIRQQLQELTSLLNQQSITGEITEAEADRRQSLLGKADIRYQDLEGQLNTNPRENDTRKEHLGNQQSSKQTVSWGPAEVNGVGTTEDRIQSQQRYAEEQDAGLDQLVAIMSRTKNIAQEFSVELDLCNEMLDEVGDQMESVDASLIRNTRRTQNLIQKSDTCCLWLIIIVLMIAIVVVAASDF